MLPLAAFLAAVLYWDGFVLASNTPRFLVLSVLIPLMAANAGVRWTNAHTLCALWMMALAVSLFWTIAFYDGLDMLWMFLLWGGAFYVGSGTRDLEPAHLAFSAGVAISGFVAAIQLGGDPLVLMTSPPAGLFVNKNFMAEAAVMAIAGLICCRSPLRWVLMPAVIAAWALPLAKGPLVAGIAVVGVMVLFRSRLRWTMAAVCGIALAGALIVGFSTDLVIRLYNPASLSNRWIIYKPLIEGLTWFGHGVGSFEAVFPGLMEADGLRPFLRSPDRAHNDVLSLAHDIGVLIALPAALMLHALRNRMKWGSELDIAFLPLAAFAACGLVGFPLYNPATGFLAALCLGHLCRARDVVDVQRRSGGTLSPHGVLAAQSRPAIVDDHPGDKCLPAVVADTPPGGDVPRDSRPDTTSDCADRD